MQHIVSLPLMVDSESQVMKSVSHYLIQVGDLMRSLKLLLYKHDQNRLEEVALDVNLNPVFLSAIAMIDDENFLGADGRHIFVCQKNR